MNLHIFHYSLLNCNSGIFNIITKKTVFFNFCGRGNFTIQTILQFKRIKFSLSSTKTRAQVQGGGKKPWKQKGTGRARIGSIRSPLHRGGGIIFGPHFTKINKQLNKKEILKLFKIVIYNRRFNFLIFTDLVTQFTLISKHFCISSLFIFTPEQILNAPLKFQNFSNCRVITLDKLTVEHLLISKRIFITFSLFKSLVAKLAN